MIGRSWVIDSCLNVNFKNETFRQMQAELLRYSRKKNNLMTRRLSMRNGDAISPLEVFPIVILMLPTSQRFGLPPSLTGSLMNLWFIGESFP